MVTNKKQKIFLLFQFRFGWRFFCCYFIISDIDLDGFDILIQLKLFVVYAVCLKYLFIIIDFYVFESSTSLNVTQLIQRSISFFSTIFFKRPARI